MTRPRRHGPVEEEPVRDVDLPDGHEHVGGQRERGGEREGARQEQKAAGELDDIRANKDCLKLFARTVTQAGVIAREELDTIDREVAALIEHAVQQAKAAPLPGPEDLLTDVYVSY